MGVFTRRLPHLAAFDDPHDAEAMPSLHAAADHIQVACFEYLQIQDATGEQYGIERKQRQLH